LTLVREFRATPHTCPGQTERVGRRDEAQERSYEQLGIDRWVVELGHRLARSEPESIEEALTFLERDPYFFRSGYARERLARRLAHAALTPVQKARARVIVLSSVDGQRHCPFPGVGKLARAVADNSLRRALRARLHHPDTTVARRALRMIADVRAPGLSTDDIAAARALLLADAARGRWLSLTVARLATYVWSGEWEVELRGLTRRHGPDRAAAKRLVDLAAQRRRRRPGP
jgi:hypothetical protein